MKGINLKKKMNLFLISMFLLVVVLPFVEVDSAVVQTVDIINPSSHESFPFSTGNEVFSGYSITTGLTPNAEYHYFYQWEIDSVNIDTGTSTKRTSGGGVLYLTGSEFDTTVDVSTFEVGEHTVSLRSKIYLVDPVTTIADDTHDHTWYRSVDPNNDPVITITAPANDYEIHNRTLSGNDYLVSWSVADSDGTIVSMDIYFDGVLNRTWVSPPETCLLYTSPSPRDRS